MKRKALEVQSMKIDLERAELQKNLQQSMSHLAMIQQFMPRTSRQLIKDQQQRQYITQTTLLECVSILAVSMLIRIWHWMVVICVSKYMSDGTWV